MYVCMYVITYIRAYVRRYVISTLLLLALDILYVKIERLTWSKKCFRHFNSLLLELLDFGKKCHELVLVSYIVNKPTK